MIGSFIVDFYRPEERLIIEVDGSIHDDDEQHDAARQATLEEFGFHVMRFRNEHVINNREEVIQTIQSWLEARA